MVYSLQSAGPGGPNRDIAALLRELNVTTNDCLAAKQIGRSDQVIRLLKRKSILLRQLFEARSALILQSRATPARL